MREIQYKTFSLRTHRNNWGFKRPSVCEFELTFRCPLHCKHCYSNCYNKAKYFKEELKTKEVKNILDKVHKSGVLWLCFTGGDPLARPDFLDIYAYTKKKGFIITIFTSGYHIDKEIVRYFRKNPPFAIELTLNAVNKKPYERISQVKGSFAKVTEAIGLITKEGLPLKIKTQVTRDNVEEMPRIKKFLAKLGLEFTPSHILHPRLNRDTSPCDLRISAQEVLHLNGKVKKDGCAIYLPEENNRRFQYRQSKNYKPPLFFCAAGGGDSFRIDPYGSIFLCSLMRKNRINLLKTEIADALNKLLPLFRNRGFLSGSACGYCTLRRYCNWCPGRAYLEKANMEAPIEHYCALAKLASAREKRR